MTTKELEKIKLTKRWPIKLSDFYRYYFFILLPFSVLAIGFSILKSSFRNNVEELIIPSLIIMLGIFLTFFTVKRLWQNQTFELIEIENLTQERIEKAIRKPNFESSKFDNFGYLTITTEESLFSWGEEITIIQDGNKFFINSRPYAQSITIIKDRNNIKNIINNIKYCQKQ